MRITGEIIAFNKRINAAITDRRIEDASKWLLRLHRLECKAGVSIGDYRLRKYIKRAAVRQHCNSSKKSQLQCRTFRSKNQCINIFVKDVRQD